MATEKRRLNVFIVHAKFLADRKSSIDDLLQNIEHGGRFDVKTVKWIKTEDPEDIASERIQRIVDYSPIPKDQPGEGLNPLLRNMHIQQLSNALKHHAAYLAIALHAKPNDVNLVIEDDVVCVVDKTKVADKLLEAAEALPSDYDVALLGLPTAPPEDSKHKFLPIGDMFPVVPAVDSYFVSRNAAQKLTTSFIPVKFPTHLQMSYVSVKAGLKIYVSVPPVFMDGSKLGAWASTLTPNNQLAYNGDYITLMKIVEKQGMLTKDDLEKASALVRTSSIRTHIDFVLLWARMKAKCCQYAEAEKLFQLVYDAQTNVRGIITSESVLLREYIALHRELQQIPA
jgi:hypothetical protein